MSRVIISGSDDKASVFLSAGSQIRGFTKRGKDFFKLDSSHTDTIVHLHVQGQELWSSGKHTLNCYVSSDSKIVDQYYYLAEDTITFMMVVNLQQALAVVAVQDKIRVISSKGQSLYESQMDSDVTCFDLDSNSSKQPVLIYGTKNGGIGAIELNSDEAILLWETEEYGQGDKAAVSHIKVASLKEGSTNLVLTREDGLIEVYTYSPKETPTLVYETRETDEKITGIAVGLFTSPKHPEIIYTCYSGAVKSVCERKAAKKIGVSADEDAVKQTHKVEQGEKQAKIEDLQK